MKIGNKLDPFYWHLRGFDRRGSTIAWTQDPSDSNIHRISGITRDLADFAVLQWDIDDIYGHLGWKYLPDFDFDGIVWEFDVSFNNFQSISSPKFESVPWRSLSYILKDGSSGTIDLFDNAIRVGGLGYLSAEGIFNFEDNGIAAFDRVTLWYNNLAFDYIVPNPPPSNALLVAIDNIIIQINQLDNPSLGSSMGIIARRSASTIVINPAIYGTCDVNGNIIARRSGEPFSGSVNGSRIVFARHTSGSQFIVETQVTEVLSQNALTTLLPLGIEDGISFLIPTGGLDGNHIEMYSIFKNNNFKTAQDTVKFNGATEDISWKVTIDFTKLGLQNIRKIWFTYAPILTDGTSFSDIVCSASYSNWNVTSSKAVLPLRIAGSNSVLVNHSDLSCCYEGSWSEFSGFFNQGFSKKSIQSQDLITITYNCSFIHDLYVGTQLSSSFGVASISLDNDTVTFLDTNLSETVTTRRILRTNVSAGEHTLILKHIDSNTFIFDYLQAVIPSEDFSVPINNEANVGVASDYDTNHWDFLLPQRSIKNITQLGLLGRINHFIGVFFALTRRRKGGIFPQLTLTFSGFANGDSVFVTLGGTTMGKSVFPADTDSTIANHFKMFINHTFVGVFATIDGNTLVITNRSPINDFTHSFTETSSTGIVTGVGSLEDGEEGDWEVSPNPTKVLNEGMIIWHTEFLREANLKDLEVIFTYGHEWVNPPDSLSDIWSSRFVDGTEVKTSTGFGNLLSTHGAFSPTVLAYEIRTYKETMDIFTSLGIKPRVQLGEKHYWFFPKGGAFASDGMAFFSQDLKDLAQSQLQRNLFDPSTPFIDPLLHLGDTNLLRDNLDQYLRDLVSALRSYNMDVEIEQLYAYDINKDISTQEGFSGVGGRYNFYINTSLFTSDFNQSTLDILKVEGLADGRTDRDNNNSRITANIYKDKFNNWTKDKVTYMLGWHDGGNPWQRDFYIGEGVDNRTFWAGDHGFFFSWQKIPQKPIKSIVR